MPRISFIKLSRLLWALVLVTLPVTSFRYLPFMGAGTTVRPLALYPLALLLPVLLVRLKRGEIQHPWPGALTVLLAFLLAALAATAFGATLAPVELRGVDFFDRALRAGITLLIGLSFFVAAVWMNQSEQDVKFSVKWLLVGLVAHLIWGAIQFIGLNTGHRQELVKIQQSFSVRGLVKNKRISGFAYEPSWLAGQIATLYLPWLVAGALMRFRALDGGRWTADDKKRSAVYGLWSFVEPLLLVAALAALLMTYSRSGLVVAILAGLATFVLAGGEAVKAFWGWVRAGFDRQRWINRMAALQAAGSRVLLAVLAVAILGAVGLFLADKGYIATFFKSDKTNLFDYAVDVYLGPRLAYATAAMTAFQEYPLTGVGLGASGFWIYQNMPDWVLAGVPEISEQLSPLSNLYPNPKNLYVRLLTETGLVGFALFLAFYLAVFAEALSLLRGFGMARWLGAAGIFALAAVMLQGVSQDSFAMPEMWINLGILAGAAGALQMQKTPRKMESQ
jgi:O-antigen ligase